MPIIREGKPPEKSAMCGCPGRPSIRECTAGTLWRCDECNWVYEHQGAEWAPVVNGWRFICVELFVGSTFLIAVGAPWVAVVGIAVLMTAASVGIVWAGLYF